MGRNTDKSIDDRKLLQTKRKLRRRLKAAISRSIRSSLKTFIGENTASLAKEVMENAKVELEDVEVQLANVLEISKKKSSIRNVLRQRDKQGLLVEDELVSEWHEKLAHFLNFQKDAEYANRKKSNDARGRHHVRNRTVRREAYRYKVKEHKKLHKSGEHHDHEHE